MAHTVSRPGSDEIGRRLTAQLMTLRNARANYEQTPTVELARLWVIAERRLDELISEWCKARIYEQAEDMAAGNQRVGSEDTA
jgi:hypothetical protein